MVEKSSFGARFTRVFKETVLHYRSHAQNSVIRSIVKANALAPESLRTATLLAIYDAYSLGFIFIERITKQDSRGNTADGRPDLGLDSKSLVDL
ncbi:hypothetical protein TNCV_2617601 [Trichonephila clavipes]|nr:hypothetical protein TNCV_2617601 [Trichonephila clavipes]